MSSSITVRDMTVLELQKRKEQLITEIQGVSESLGQLLQERHCLRDQVEGRHVTIAQLLRVQEARAAQLGLQPPVQMSVDAGRR